MDVLEAQRTRVIRLPALLSKMEIRAIRHLAAEFRKRPGHNKTMPWQVLFLQTDGRFMESLPEIFEKMREAVLQVDRQNWGVIGDGSCNLRVAEFHRHTSPSEGLPDPHHYDMGSLVTIDVLLGDGSFEGGCFQTLEPDGSLTEHSMAPGDALLFVSHKYHCVSPVTTGIREVLVLEFWRGPEQRCGHRYEVMEESIAALSNVSAGFGDVPLPQQMDPEAPEWALFN